MAKNEVSNIQKDIREKASIWLGKTNQKGDVRLLLIRFDNTWRKYYITVEDNKYSIEADEEDICYEQSIRKIIHEIYSDLEHDKVISSKTFSVNKNAAIVGDFNKDFYDQGIIPLPYTSIEPALKDLGFDISKYEYTVQNISNKHGLKAAPIDNDIIYDPAVKPYLADLSKVSNYILSKDEEVIFRCLDKGCYKAVLLMGGPGVGKSTGAKVYCAQHKRQVIVSECVAGMDSDFLTNNFVPNKSGGYDLIWGPLVYAVVYGTWFILNEINYGDPAVVSVIHSILDDSAHIRLHDGTIKEVHPNFRMVLTGNPGFIGTNKLNEATKDRCATYIYPDMTPEALIQRLKINTKYENDNVLKAIASAFDSIRNIYRNRNWSTETTYRGAERFCKMLLMDGEDALDLKFDMSFVYGAYDDMNSIAIEIEELKEIRKDYVESIQQSLKSSSKSVELGSLHFDKDPIQLSGVNMNDDASYDEL